MKKLLSTTFLAVGTLAFSAPAFGQAETPAGEPGQEQPAADAADAGNAATGMEASAQAQAVIEGDGIEGTATFTETPTGIVVIEIEATGLEPGPHGVHFHETGSCDAESGHESAGGHIAGDAEHGVMNDSGPHPGDLPNIHVQEDGVAHAEFFSNDITLSADSGMTLLDDDGSAFIIHAGADDYTTDPEGNAGDRIACGVVETSV